MQDFFDSLLRLTPVVLPLVILSTWLLRLGGTLMKLIIRPKLSLYPAGEIEIGFNRFGPSATLFGTMQAQRGDFFITKIEAVFRQPATNFVRTLEWRALKPYVFGLGAEDEVKYELVAAFALKASEPFKYNIVFIDDSFINQELERVRQVTNAWQNFQAEADQALIGHARLEAFYAQPEIQAIAQAWEERMYWQAGAYELDLKLYSNKRHFPFTYRFTLGASEVEILRSNVKVMIFYLCGERGVFGRAFAPYQQEA